MTNNNNNKVIYLLTQQPIGELRSQHEYKNNICYKENRDRTK